MEIRAIPLRAIQPNPEQPRSHFDPVKLAELAVSIKARGGVLYAWADRYYHRRDRVMLLTALYTVGNTTAQRLRGLYERLRRAGIDPYQQVNR